MANANLDHAFLRYANLVGAQLGGASLKKADCRGADCRGVSLRGVELECAILNKANLRSAKLDGARLSKADLEECNLERADMRSVKLTKSVLKRANLKGADLTNARLEEADLSFCNLSQANLRNANLRGATATGADFTLAILHLSVFDGANITDSHLWESQRAGWSIKDVICERTFWDKDASVISTFGVGEFERLYGDQLTIDLFYEVGITSFELNTLPALLHELSKLHPVCRLRLASITETNGGALITIRAEDVEQDELVSLRREAERMRDMQTSLRASNLLADRLQIEKTLLLDEVFPRLAARSVNTVNIVAPSTHLAIGFDQSSPQITHSGIEGETLLELLSNIKTQTASLPAKQSLAIEIAEAIENAQDAVNQKEKKPNVLRQALKAVQDAAIKALASQTTSMLGDRLPSLLQQLEHFIKFSM